MADPSSGKVVAAALVGNGLIAISKFVAGAITGSTSMLAEAVHSVADTLNQALLMFGMKRAQRKPTALHPMGYAAESYFWPFMVSIMIFLLGGVFALYEGIHGLIELQAAPDAPHEGGSHLWDYAVLSTAILFEGFSFVVAMREFRKMKGRRKTLDVILESKDPTIPVVLLEDSAAMIGLVVALLAIALSEITGWVGWDCVGSIVIGALLCSVSYLLSRETHSLLLGESASDEDRQRVVRIVEGDASVTRVTQLLSMHRGPDDVCLAQGRLRALARRPAASRKAIDRIEAGSEPSCRG
ncbi:MAG: cation diffusion facilitator family transporter [Sandaracinaceae bacterium]